MDWLEDFKRLKNESGKSIREISQLSGVPEPTLEKLFAGQTKNPGIRTVSQVLHAIGYSLDDIDNKKPTHEGELSKETEHIIEILRMVPEPDLPLAHALVKSVLLTIIQHSQVPAEMQSAAPLVINR